MRKGSKLVGIIGVFPFYWANYKELFGNFQDCDGPDFMGDKLRSKEFYEKLHNSDDANDFGREERIAMAWLAGIPIWEIDGKILDPPPLALEKKDGAWHVSRRGTKGEARPLFARAPLDSFVRDMRIA